jgi:hypothetical protein
MNVLGCIEELGLSVEVETFHIPLEIIIINGRMLDKGESEIFLVSVIKNLETLG